MNKNHNHILLSIKNSKKIINLDGIRAYNLGTKYPVIKETASQIHFQFGSDFYTFLWTDQALSLKEIRELPPQVKVNHFP